VDDEEYMNSRPSVGYDDMWAKTILEYEVDASVKHLFKLLDSKYSTEIL
jgi:hypothetical protein